MLAPLATLAILAAIWLVSFVAAEMLSRSDKIVAALQGHSMLATAPSVRHISVRVNQRSRPRLTLRADLQLRAAA